PALTACWPDNPSFASAHLTSGEIGGRFPGFLPHTNCSLYFLPEIIPLFFSTRVPTFATHSPVAFNPSDIKCGMRIVSTTHVIVSAIAFSKISSILYRLQLQSVRCSI